MCCSLSPLSLMALWRPIDYKGVLSRHDEVEGLNRGWAHGMVSPNPVA